MKEQFIDRKKEIRQISKIIQQENSKSKVILLSGKSGIGKSGLVQKLNNSNLIAAPILSIHVSKSSVETIENSQYLSAIYKALSIYAKEKPFDKILSPTQQGFQNPKNIARVLGGLIKSKLGIKDAESLSEPEEQLSIVRKKDYIISVLEKSSLILDIENVQNIDTVSFEILKEILLTIRKPCIFFMEYTLMPEEHSHYQNFYNELKNLDIDIVGFQVEKMDFLFARRLAPQDKIINEAHLKELYDNSQGNLMEIILADEAASLKECSIHITINKLSKNQKIIVYLLFLNDTEMTYKQLFNIFVLPDYCEESPFFEPNIFNELLEQLRLKNIIVEADNKIYLKHDSIKKELYNYMQNPIMFQAYAMLKSYYNEIFAMDPQDTNAIEKLLFLYLQFVDQELLLILPNLKSIIMEHKYPQLILKKLAYYREQLNKNSLMGFKATYHLTIMLIEICLSKKMAKEAQNYLRFIYDESNPYHLAIKSQILSLGETEKDCKELARLTNDIEPNTRLRLISEINFLYVKTKLHPTSDTRPYGQALIDNKKYKNYPEYAYLLRNFAELCDDTAKCFTLYNAALELFSKYNNRHDMASVYISLSMMYSYIGEMNTALECIEEALKLDKRELSLCYVYNNQAAISILEKRYSRGTEKLLRDAVLLCESTYEQIIIYCNLLVYYSLTEDSENARHFANKIEESNFKDFHYEEFLHIVYQNLYYYYSKMDSKNNKLKIYYTQLKKLYKDPNIRDSTKKLVAGMNHFEPSNIFYAQFPFRVDFLGYWEFTISSDLDRFE